MRRIGAHVGSDRPLDHAREIGADVVQIFLSNPQSWKKPGERPDADDLAASEIPIYVHAPYLINPVTSPGFSSAIMWPARSTTANSDSGI